MNQISFKIESSILIHQTASSAQKHRLQKPEHLLLANRNSISSIRYLSQLQQQRMNPAKKPETAEEKALMDQPYIYKRCPKSMKLQAGKQYRYCACGLSNTQPFCDDSHIGTAFKPITFTAKNQVYSSICLCKRANEYSLPYCDKTHNELNF